MSVDTVKGGGLAGLLAATLFLITTVIDVIAPVETVYDSPNEYVYQTLSTVAFLGAVGAVIGFWPLLSRARRFRRLGTVAVWLTGVGYTVVALVNAISIAQGERSLVTVRIAAALTLLIVGLRRSRVAGQDLFASRAGLGDSWLVLSWAPDRRLPKGCGRFASGMPLVERP